MHRPVLAAFLLAIQSPATLPPGAPMPAAPAPSVSDGGQEAPDYSAWLAANPAAPPQLQAFDSFLAQNNVAGVVPTWQLIRTASMWRRCAGQPFEIPPAEEWPHVVRALAFVKTHIVPIIGPVEPVSSYRNEALNACAHGARESAHRHFYAVDLVPLRPFPRDGLIRSLCLIHEWRGAEYETGLGFYEGLRFHIDAKGFRRWGPDGKAATSPCNPPASPVAPVAPVQPQTPPQSATSPKA
jgi:hypothetical protein